MKRFLLLFGASALAGMFVPNGASAAAYPGLGAPAQKVSSVGVTRAQWRGQFRCYDDAQGRQICHPYSNAESQPPRPPSRSLAPDMGFTDGPGVGGGYMVPEDGPGVGGGYMMPEDEPEDEAGVDPAGPGPNAGPQ